MPQKHISRLIYSVTMAETIVPNWAKPRNNHACRQLSRTMWRTVIAAPSFQPLKYLSRDSITRVIRSAGHCRCRCLTESCCSSAEKQYYHKAACNNGVRTSRRGGTYQCNGWRLLLRPLPRPVKIDTYDKVIYRQNS
ncbi:hypothetical protein J6590_012439 [Homalodisca vitripennis]|nr:hypothetical protein J6590_012439 [Homalodisca vitripennis]